MFDLILISVILLLIWWYKAFSVPKAFPPGPRLPLPVIGDAYVLGSNFAEGFHKIKAQYGPIVGLFLGPNPTIIVSDYDLLSEILNKEEFSFRPYFEITKDVRRNFSINKECPGILFGNGKTWQEHRRFALSTLRDFGFGKKEMEESIEDDIYEFLKYLVNEFDGQKVDMRHHLQVVVLNSLWKVIAGEELTYKDEKFLYLLKLIDDLVGEQGSTLGNILQFYPKLYRLLVKFNLLKTQHIFHDLLEFCDKSIKEHVDTYQADNLRDFVDSYLKHAKGFEDKHESSFQKRYAMNNLSSDLVDLFIAGSETTSTTLNWSLLFMIAYPDIQKKVQDELDLIVGRNRLPKVSDRPSLPFTEAVIHEIQRLGNILPFGVYHAVFQDVTVHGHFIPAGAHIMTDLGNIHMDPKLFTDPQKFNPYRYLDKNGNFIPNKYVIPFGIGKRRCLGETLAKVTLFKIFTSILHRYNVLHGDSEKMINLDPTTRFTNSPKPFTVRFEQR